MKKLRNKAFTLTETIIVITIIGLLMTAMTAYLGGQGQQAKLIEAEGCANTLQGYISNYTYYALTNKALKIGSNSINPEIYTIQLSGGNSSQTKAENCTSSGHYCNEIILSYGEYNHNTNKIKNITKYNTYTSRNNCRQNSAANLHFFRSGSNIKYIVMNKGFIENSASSDKVFYLQDWDDKNILTGSIMILLTNDDGTGGREIGKRDIDARSQTISLHKCKVFNQDNRLICEEREN